MIASHPIVCLDVHYTGDAATTAAVLFSDWQDATALHELIVQTRSPADYEPGQFYKRELPCLLAALDALVQTPALILVDGYVWLGPDRPGLGAHLHEALGGNIPVVGVAKTRFQAQHAAIEVLRGTSQRPLFVTAIGIEAAIVGHHVLHMHGDHRIPTLIKRADQLCRGLVNPTP